MTKRPFRLSVCGTAMAMIAIPLSLFGSVRVSFVRTIPAPRDLGRAERIAIVYTIGDNDKISTFVEAFLTQTNRGGILRVDDASQSAQHFFAERPDPQTMKHIRREHPADAWIGVRRFTCESRPASGEGSVRNAAGERIKQRQFWIDAVCRARIEVFSGESWARLLAFEVSGEGTSPRVSELTDEERNIALAQAARYAAVSAAEAITPRRVRETIDLDENVPLLAEAQSLLDAERLAEARSLWEAELRRRPTAALHFDIAALCEALGDLGPARTHYAEAERLAPGEARYRVEFERFRKRTSMASVSRRVE